MKLFSGLGFRDFTLVDSWNTCETICYDVAARLATYDVLNWNSDSKTCFLESPLEVAWSWPPRLTWPAWLTRLPCPGWFVVRFLLLLLIMITMILIWFNYIIIIIMIILQASHIAHRSRRSAAEPVFSLLYQCCQFVNLLYQICCTNVSVCGVMGRRSSAACDVL